MDEHETVLLVDESAPLVRRLTLNRPNKRNALDDQLRSALFDGLRDADGAPDVSVVIVRGAGPSFCAGYDLSALNHAVERHASPSDGWWSRHVVAGWFEMWDMSTPLIAQVHGYCQAGGTELAAACDRVYVADDAQIGYPPVRLMSPPDLAWQPWLMGMRRAMESCSRATRSPVPRRCRSGSPTGRSRWSVSATRWWRSPNVSPRFPPSCWPLNKRVVHRAMEAAGMRGGLCGTADIQAPGFHQRSSRAYMKSFTERGVSAALAERDKPFGDYRGSGVTGGQKE